MSETTRQCENNLSLLGFPKHSAVRNTQMPARGILAHGLVFVASRPESLARGINSAFYNKFMATRKKAETPVTAESANPVPASGGPTEKEAQMIALEQGLALFRELRFAEAKGSFEKAARGSQANVRLTAKTHLSVCERRLKKPVLELTTADDHYNYGVERLNARDLEAARRHLEISLALRPNTDYVLYAFAGALALSGDISASYENLRRAIDLNPANRNSARQDPDFQSVTHNPLFSQLLHPERHQPF